VSQLTKNAGMPKFSRAFCTAAQLLKSSYSIDSILQMNSRMYLVHLAPKLPLLEAITAPTPELFDKGVFFFLGEPFL
jgi:hypothetical protein